jgi:CRP-like cAMP-binding protein
MSDASEFAKVIATVPLFEGLSKRQLASIAHVCFEAVYSPGDIIVREGDRTAEHMVVITEGTAEVTHKGKNLTTLGAGEVVGEMALLDGLPRSASVTAETDVRAIVLYRSAFQALLEEVPGMYARLLTTLSKRLRAQDERLASLG